MSQTPHPLYYFGLFNRGEWIPVSKLEDVLSYYADPESIEYTIVGTQARKGSSKPVSTSSGRVSKKPVKFSDMTFTKGSGAVERAGFDGTDMEYGL
jgi:hypothetical protein